MRPSKDHDHPPSSVQQQPTTRRSGAGTTTTGGMTHNPSTSTDNPKTAAENNNINTTDLVAAGVIRPRADSSGSTRGAFYPDGAGTPEYYHAAAAAVQEMNSHMDQQQQQQQQQRANKYYNKAGNKQYTKTSKLQQQPRPKIHNKPTSIADMAALAMESLEPGDMQPLNSTQPFAQPYHDDEPASAIQKRSSSKATAARHAMIQAQQRSRRQQQQRLLVMDPIPDLDDSNNNNSAAVTSSSSSKRPNFHAKNFRIFDLLFQRGGDSLDFLGNKDYTRQGSGPLLGDALLESPQPSFRTAPSQQDEIKYFSNLVQSSAHNLNYGAVSSDRDDDEDDPSNDIHDITETTIDDASYTGIGTFRYMLHRIRNLLDPTEWLKRDVHVDEDGLPAYDQRYTLAALVRHLLYNPISPEFTSLQLFDWSVIIGIIMGLYTAGWKMFIDMGVDFFWDTVPEHLMEWGIFTELDGAFPIYHYMWICPAIFGGVLSYIFVKMPNIPDQNTWNTSVHTRGVLDHDTFLPLFLLSTMGMWSGLSLGPELPLVLTAGMVGSWLGLLTHQSMLQARVLNMTTASAAVGGFFGFPMAGALFVLEIPHRMGLQYFEALSPGTISSIVAVLVNRLVTGNDVTGYYKYPFLTASLPSSIFSSAIVYGLYGSLVGIFYAHGTKFLKGWVHNWFHAHHSHHGGPNKDHRDDKDDNTEKDITVGDGSSESVPLISVKKRKVIPKPQPRMTLLGCVRAYFCLAIPNKTLRATVAGIVAGAIVGAVGIFVPHTMFWGEAQLQNLIDKGRTPLPIFGENDDDNKLTAGFLAHAMCMIDPTDNEAIQAGFGLECSALIAVSKVFVIGLSLGTGIIGGHFWGPLFVGCAASHFFTDLVKIFDDRFGFGGGLATYPCVVILCTMGSAHVVTFRAHMAIMLILTLTISAFDPEDVNSPFEVAGDYSAVFPLLVVSVFISLMTSRDTVFYPTQRSRGDITAVPEVLCQPGMSGTPLVVVHEHSSDDWSYYDDEGSYGDDGSFLSETGSDVKIEQSITQNDIENAFEAAKTSGFKNMSKPQLDTFAIASSKDVRDGKHASVRVDDLLRAPVEPKHRRVHSAPDRDHPALSRSRSDSRDLGAVVIHPAPPSPMQGGSRSRTSSTGSQRDLVRVQSFGEIQQHQPSLMEQARLRAASSVAVAELSPSSATGAGQRRVPSTPLGVAGGRHQRIPSLPMAGRGRSHSRQNSQNSQSMLNTLGSEPEALSVDDIQSSFDAVVNEKLMSKSPWSIQSNKQGSFFK